MFSPIQCLLGVGSRRVTSKCGNGEEPEGTKLNRRNGDMTSCRCFYLNREIAGFKNQNSGVWQKYQFNLGRHQFLGLGDLVGGEELGTLFWRLFAVA